MITNEMLEIRNELMFFVSNLTGVPVDDIMGNDRNTTTSTARQLVMWALVTLCGYTHTETGILMRRNHATIAYAVSHVGAGYYGKVVESIRKQIKDYYNERKSQKEH